MNFNQSNFNVANQFKRGKTNRHRDMLVSKKGYEYIYQKMKKGNRWWRCKKTRRTKCKAQFYTDENMLVVSNFQQHHTCQRIGYDILNQEGRSIEDMEPLPNLQSTTNKNNNNMDIPFDIKHLGYVLRHMQPQTDFYYQVQPLQNLFIQGMNNQYSERYVHQGINEGKRFSQNKVLTNDEQKDSYFNQELGIRNQSNLPDPSLGAYSYFKNQQVSQQINPGCNGAGGGEGKISKTHQNNWSINMMKNSILDSRDITYDQSQINISSSERKQIGNGCDQDLDISPFDYNKEKHVEFKIDIVNPSSQLQ